VYLVRRGDARAAADETDLFQSSFVSVDLNAPFAQVCKMPDGSLYCVCVCVCVCVLYRQTHRHTHTHTHIHTHIHTHTYTYIDLDSDGIAEAKVFGI
jgi:hypothetical protein